MNNDLGYSIKDREINAFRLTRLIRNFHFKRHIIISLILFFKNIEIGKKNISHFLEVYIESSKFLNKR